MRRTPGDQATAGVALEDRTLGNLGPDRSDPQARTIKKDDLRIDVCKLSDLDVLSESEAQHERKKFKQCHTPFVRLRR